MRYVYFVHYVAYRNTRLILDGNCEVFNDSRITRHSEIVDIQNKLLADKSVNIVGADAFLVYNYDLLRVERDQ